MPELSDWPEVDVSSCGGINLGPVFLLVLVFVGVPTSESSDSSSESSSLLDKVWAFGMGIGAEDATELSVS